MVEQPRKIRVLIIEDSEIDAELIVHQLKKSNFIVDFSRIETEDEMLNEINNKTWDFIIADYNLPKFNGMKALSILKERKLEVPFILVSGTIGEEKAVEIMKAGANDYILKDRLTRLPQAMRRELTELENKRKMELALHESEDLIRQGHKMEAASKLAGVIAHDFNNLLNNILLNCESLMMDYPDNEQIQSCAGRILNAQKKATFLTQQLLLFSKQQINYPKTIININEIVSNLKKLDEELNDKNIALNINLLKSDLLIMANSMHIEQVLINIIENAKEAMLDGGVITIATSSESILNADNNFKIPVGNYIKLQIKDTGCGITPEALRHIYEPFFTTKDSGKGLGLSVVSGIVKQYSGYIFIESELKKGTTVNIFIPLEKSEVISEATNGSKKKIRTM